MKTYKLDPEEKQFLEDYGKGKYKSVKNLEKEKKRYQEYARNTLQKLKNINNRSYAVICHPERQRRISRVCEILK